MTSAAPKAPCVTCGKSAGLFNCEGCGQTFCMKHVIEHRQTLSHQLEEIVIEHDTLQETLLNDKDQELLLFKHIDKWERKSTETIKRIAQDTRQELLEFTNMCKKNIAQELNNLAEQIKFARKEEDYFETDLRQWVLTLDRLKNQLLNTSSQSDIEEDRSKPIIYQIKRLTVVNSQNTLHKKYPSPNKMICQDSFDWCLDGAEIEDNGRVVTHNKNNSSVAIRGKGTYSAGAHEFRLQIEKNPLNTWIFFGIISKSDLPTKNSYESSSAYGWADFNDFFLAGDRQNEKTTGQFTHTHENDVIQLILDCINRKITYTNERNLNYQEIYVDLHQCPFPWQLHVNFFGECDRVRLLSTKSLC
ncbi:unnamed protein product [Adineta ricciae]|uniref:Uncharacterized protein n=1 Tax=Adineta ricciae TaxID=249248 RepID=A0A814UNH5_ADIRI|nr:unnamed protein product [Adineta ricciae]